MTTSTSDLSTNRPGRTGDFDPEGWTAEQAVSAFIEGADWDVDVLGHEQDLYWVTPSTTCSVEGETGEDLSLTTMLGQAGSPWVFSAMAGTPEARGGRPRSVRDRRELTTCRPTGRRTRPFAGLRCVLW